MTIQTIIDKLENELYLSYTLSSDYLGLKEDFLPKLKDSLTSMLDGIVENGPQRMEHKEGETEEWKNIVSEHNGCVYDFHKIINSHK